MNVQNFRYIFRNLSKASDNRANVVKFTILAQKNSQPDKQYLLSVGTIIFGRFSSKIDRCAKNYRTTR